MTSAPVSQRARELLADEWEKAGRPGLAVTIRRGREDEWSKAGPAVRAIDRALSDRVIGLPSREEIARAMFEADPNVGTSWNDWVSYAQVHKDHLQDIDWHLRAADAILSLLGGGE